MKKVTYKFVNPNTEEDFRKYLEDVVVKAAAHRVMVMLENGELMMDEQKVEEK